MEGLCREPHMSMPLIMKRLGSDINTEGNLSPRTRVQPQDLTLYELWVTFSSHRIKGITFQTVEVLINTSLNCVSSLSASVNELIFKVPCHLSTLPFLLL